MYRPWILTFVIGAIAGGCYHPRVEGACEVGCEFGARDQCPNGLQCGADNLCFDETPCDQLPLDGGTDGDIDSPIVNSDCYPTLLMGNVCPTLSTVLVAVVYGNPDGINTNNNTSCTEVLSLASGEVCLIAAETIAINAHVRITGSRPLALFARATFSLGPGGSLDVSAGGAGVRAQCTSPTGYTQGKVGEPSGGGAGGTMAARGGNGGEGLGFPHVVAPPPILITSLRGGCDGGNGGDRVSANGSGGAGGDAGGGIQIISPGLVEISGTVDAYGEGGFGGNGGAGGAAGGGGGGSGGVIAIDATSIAIRASAMMRAHGGGGGGGVTGNGLGVMGGPGASVIGDAASGGSGTGGNSGAGGVGSSDAVRMGIMGDPSMTGASGAGGGGGGAGSILVRSQSTSVELGAQIHPPSLSAPI